MLTTKPSLSDATVSAIQSDYVKKYAYYPLEKYIDISPDVYVTEQIFTFWQDVSPFLPYGSKISKGYVRPDDHALAGLTKLKELNPNYDFSAIASTRSSATVSADNSSGSSFFSTTPSTESTSTLSTSSVTRTHPGLNGKFGDYYLFQFDYNTVQSVLSGLGYTWTLPFSDNYQKGLALDIDISEVASTITPDALTALLTTIATANTYLNIKSCSYSGSVITILFIDSTLPSFPFEYGILNIGSSSNVSDAFSQSTVQKIYKHLKDNGYGDIDEKVSGSALKGLPASVRKRGTALSIALKDILIDVLGGSKGLLSTFQGSTNEYLIGLINGLLAANKVVYDELDRIGGGTVKEKAINAFQSGMNRATVSKSINSLLNNGMDLNQSSGVSLSIVETDEVVASNIDLIKTSLATARTQDNAAATKQSL